LGNLFVSFFECGKFSFQKSKIKIQIAKLQRKMQNYFLSVFVLDA